MKKFEGMNDDGSPIYSDYGTTNNGIKFADQLADIHGEQLDPNYIPDSQKPKFEEAVQETPTEQMDRILEVHEQWETVNLLIKLLNRELKIDDKAKPEEVRNAMISLQTTYKATMEEWRAIQQQKAMVKTIDTMTPERVNKREK